MHLLFRRWSEHVEVQGAGVGHCGHQTVNQSSYDILLFNTSSQSGLQPKWNSYLWTFPTDLASYGTQTLWEEPKEKLTLLMHLACSQRCVCTRTHINHVPCHSCCLLNPSGGTIFRVSVKGDAVSLCLVWCHARLGNAAWSLCQGLAGFWKSMTWFQCSIQHKTSIGVILIQTVPLSPYKGGRHRGAYYAQSIIG